MKKLSIKLSILLLLLLAFNTKSEVYEYKDKSGHVIFSNSTPLYSTHFHTVGPLPSNHLIHITNKDTSPQKSAPNQSSKFTHSPYSDEG
jgi:Domain of unknown function (DUF4124)